MPKPNETLTPLHLQRVSFGPRTCSKDRDRVDDLVRSMASVTFVTATPSARCRTNRAKRRKPKLSTPSPPTSPKTERWYEIRSTRFAKRRQTSVTVFFDGQPIDLESGGIFRFEATLKVVSSKKEARSGRQSQRRILSRRSSSTERRCESPNPQAIDPNRFSIGLPGSIGTLGRGLIHRCPVFSRLPADLRRAGEAKFLIGFSRDLLPRRAAAYMMAGQAAVECLQPRIRVVGVCLVVLLISKHVGHRTGSWAP